jgi:DNA polymerase III epsilon subunit-like protein
MYTPPNASAPRNVTPIDFYRLGAGLYGSSAVQLDEELVRLSPENENFLPPPPPTPVCIDRAERADQDAPLGSPTSTKSTNSTPIEYKKSCIARAKAARQAVASTHIVGATPRRIVEETSDELAEDDDSELPGDSLLLEPRAEQPTFLTRPVLDITFGGSRPRPVLFWDTETAGLGKPAICQLAYLLVSAEGLQTTYDKVWKLPHSVYMSKEATKIHGITSEWAMRRGIDPSNDILAFWNLARNVLREGGVVVGHNVQFDCRAFNFTSEKWGLCKTLHSDDMLDTMRESKRFSTLQTINGRQKAFKLEELCERLPPERRHASFLNCLVRARRQAPLGTLPCMGQAPLGDGRRSRHRAVLSGGEREGMVVSFTPDASLCMAHEALLAERTTRSLSQTLA